MLNWLLCAATLQLDYTLPVKILQGFTGFNKAVLPISAPNHQCWAALKQCYESSVDSLLHSHFLCTIREIRFGKTLKL
jgi:hypothetical protein